MLWRHDGTAEALRSPIPWLVLSGCLALVAFGWNAVDRSRRQDAQQQFTARTESVLAALKTRIATDEELVRDAAAFIAATPDLSRQRFRAYVAGLKLAARHPGIQAIGWAARSARGSQESVVVTYIEPFAGRNVRALGLDIYQDPTRRAAMELAAERADAVLSGRVKLAGDSPADPGPPQAGTIFYAPVGDAGFAFAPLRMHEFVRGIVDEAALETLDVALYDGPVPGEATLLADTRQVFHGAAATSPAFERSARLNLPGRVWTLRFASRPAFEAGMASPRPWVVGVLGGIASVVLFLVTLAVKAAWIRTHQMSMRDPLTGLFNRRYVEVTMPRELTRAKRRGESIGVIVLDLDHFKALNDTHGHNAGDKVLVRVGELLREHTRGSDIPCRLGGEEFGIILPGAGLEIARERAEFIRDGFARQDIAFGGVHLGPLTLSAGVAALRPQDTDWSYVLLQADRALYAAKQAGRNRVMASPAA